MSKFQVLSGDQTFNNEDDFQNARIKFEYDQDTAAVLAIDSHLKTASIEDTECFNMFTTVLMEKTNLEILVDIDTYIRMYKAFIANRDKESASRAWQ